MLNKLLQFENNSTSSAKLDNKLSKKIPWKSLFPDN